MVKFGFIQAYANGLLSDDELLDLSDTNVASPHSAQCHASVSSPRAKLQGGTSTVWSRSKLSSDNPAVNAKKTMTKAELEVNTNANMMRRALRFVQADVRSMPAF